MSAPALSDLTITLLGSISFVSSTLYLQTVSFWNSKIEGALLRQVTPSRFIERSTLVLYLQFNFLHQQ